VKLRAIHLAAAATLLFTGCFSFPKFGAAQKIERDRLKRAIEVNPANAHAAFSLGKTNLDAGEFDAAAGYFAKAVATNPKFEEAWLGLGISRLESGNLSGAEDAYRKLLAFSPESAGAYEGLATISLERRDLPKAADMANKALAIDPKSAQGLRVLGETHYIKGEYAQALEVWDRNRTEAGGDAGRDPFQNDLRQYLEKYGAGR